jgi:alpha-glucosidase (family GH31 glycosyl hydrolase)
VRSDLFIETGVYTLWNHPQGNTVADGKSPGKNLHGSHPFYMAKANDSNWFGVYHNLAAAQDWWVLNDAASAKVYLKTMAVRGVADIYIMVGDTPDQVTQSYHHLVGTPQLIPQWALGWHQSKYGYHDWLDIYNDIYKYQSFELPLEAQWIDIDYMDSFKSFTIDSERFGTMPQMTLDFQKNSSIKFVPIIDPGIAQRLTGYS